VTADRHDPELKPFWDGTDRDELRVQRCAACQTWRWPPRPACATCGSLDTEWVAVPGRGELFSWTVVGRATLPEFEDQVPYAVGIVALDDAPVRLIGRIETDDPWALQMAMPVTAVFRDHASGVRLALWRPSAAT
jgi:uncharacterized OB-fold protein